MKNNKGFTLIELLVVIAIIGILASVVLASLSSARQKGKVAAIQSTLSSMRAQAEVGVTNGRYALNVCKGAVNTGGLIALMDYLNLPSSKVVSLRCGQDTAATVQPLKWAVEASIKVDGTNETYYCADYTGYSGLSKVGAAVAGSGSALGSGVTVTSPRSVTSGAYTFAVSQTGATDLLCTHS
jgi:prepilin-type N-terminal cleavage/methylation domain-containing protein